MAKVSIIGGGSWGIALASLLAKNGHEITVWSALEKEIAMLREHREHKMLPGVKLPENVVFTLDEKEAAEGKDLLVMSVASSYTRETAHRFGPFVAGGGGGGGEAQFRDQDNRVVLIAPNISPF